MCEFGNSIGNTSVNAQLSHFLYVLMVGMEKSLVSEFRRDSLAHSGYNWVEDMVQTNSVGLFLIENSEVNVIKVVLDTFFCGEIEALGAAKIVG